MMKRKMMVFAAAALAAALAVTACGGSGKTTAETTAAAQTETAEAETDAAAKAETAEAAAPESGAERTDAAEVTSAPAAEVTEKTYTSKDGWAVDYPESLIAVTETSDGTNFVYTGDCAGAEVVSISYIPDKQPREVLYEKTAKEDPENIDRSEGWFGGFPDNWSFTYSIIPKTEGGDGLQESWTAVEHNGGVLLVSYLTHKDPDEERSMMVSDTLSELVDSIRFDHHDPQVEFAYVTGTYQNIRNEEIEGKQMSFTDTVRLNPDHTGTFSFQDDVDVYWTSTEIVETNSGIRHEYTVEGDTLMISEDGNWISFDRVPENR